MDYQTFKKAFSNLGEISSVTGRASYHSIRVSGNNLSLTRKKSSNVISISLTELYSVYQKLDFINTTILRDYITGRVYSPSLAVLIAAGFYDKKGYRLEKPEVETCPTEETQQTLTSEIPEPSVVVKKAKPMKEESDEERFFRMLAVVIGADYLQAKGIDKPVDKDLVELPCDYRKLTFRPEIKLMLHTIVEQLDGDFNFGSNSLASKIDGLIIEHPNAGTRIVEFDEEQHFTPPRLFTLKTLAETLDIPYFTEYITICNDTGYLNSQVFPKHRIKAGMNKLPANIREFQDWLSQHTKSSGYIEAKNGFPYHGGRIAQRAYYDTLRDVAHLAKENDHLKSVLRFAKKSFETELLKSFVNITDAELETSIRVMLCRFYEIKTAQKV